MKKSLSTKTIMVIIIMLIIVAGLISYLFTHRENPVTSIPSNTTTRTPEITNIENKSTRVIRIGLIPVIDSFLFIVAEKENLFEKEGLAVEIIWFSSAKERDDALLSGRIDIAVHDPVGSILLYSRGAPIKIIGFVCCEYDNESNIGFYLLSRPGLELSRNISSIAVSRNTIIEYVAWRMLNSLGLDPRRIDFVDVPSILNRYQLLIDGKLDYAVLPDPWGSLAIRNNASVIAFHRDLVVLVAREEILRDQVARSSVVKILRLLNESVDLYNRDPLKYRSDIAEKLMIPKELREVFELKWMSHIRKMPEEVFSDAVSWLIEKQLISRNISYNEVVEDLIK